MNWMFDVRSYYQAFQVESRIDFFWRAIRKTKSLKKVEVFVWTVVHGKILMVDNFCRQNIIMVGWCCMCKKLLGDN